MRKLITLSLAFAVAGVLNAAAVDPAAALAEARAQIAAKKYASAAALLSPAIKAADEITNASEKKQALTALHFYAAVAFSGANDEAQATQHLQTFMQLAPEMRHVDPAKYDGRFVELFKRMIDGGESAEPSMSFDAIYPGFDGAAPAAAAQAGTFGESPAVELLASRAEKREWRAVIDQAERERFIAEFWKRRDPDPATPENEFQTNFERRVAFADHTFATSSERGALTDRGRVFVLLGAPGSVRRAPITARDKIQLFERLEEQINGTIEHWTYAGSQLPNAARKRIVGFRFVTQRGIGEHVLQREDAFAMQALAHAMNPRD